jgi:hypothetical protein
VSVIGATYSEQGVFLFGDAKRTDLLVDTKLPPVIKVTDVLKWGFLGTGGPGSLGAALREFLKSILYPYPPSTTALLSECQGAMRFMYRRYVALTGSNLSLVSVLGCVPPGAAPAIWTFNSSDDFEPTPLDSKQPFWLCASNTERAVKVMGGLWSPAILTSKDLAAEWAKAGVEALSREFEAIGPPTSIHFVSKAGERISGLI